MHYANGREARVGDVVRGKGYNIKHEIIGLMTKISTGSSSCNCEVACVYAGSLVMVYAHPDGSTQLPNNVAMFHYAGRIGNGGCHVTATIEYGQCDAFVALDPKTGEVLTKE